MADVTGPSVGARQKITEQRVIRQLRLDDKMRRSGRGTQGCTGSLRPPQLETDTQFGAFSCPDVYRLIGHTKLRVVNL